MTLPDKDLALIESFKGRVYSAEMAGKMAALFSIIDRQSKALERAMERISEETTSIHTASIMIEIQALLDGDEKLSAQSKE